MTVTELRTNLSALLRYFLSSVVGVFLVWAFDRDHDAILAFVGQAWPQSSPTSWPAAWAVVGAFGALGLTTYCIHRAGLHLAIQRVIRCFRPQWPPDSELRFARWIRVGAPKGSPAHSLQAGLDEMSATAHFLYCSVWASVMTAGAAALVTSKMNPTLWILAPVAALFGLGIYADYRASRTDVEVFRAEPSLRPAD